MIYECPAPKIENKTSLWSSHDKDVLKQAEKHCKTFYGEDHCIRVITKTGDNSYQVICYDLKETK